MAESQRSDYLAPGFLDLLTKDNINLAYTRTRSLVNSQYKQLAPRIGIAWQLNNKVVGRSGFGLFYGGLESIVGAPNLGYSYPFQYSVSSRRTTCKPDACPSIGPIYGINLANGFSTQPGWDNGLAKDPTPPRRA